MPHDDLDRVHDQLPDLFMDKTLPTSWDEDLILIPIDKPESPLGLYPDSEMAVESDLFPDSTVDMRVGDPVGLLYEPTEILGELSGLGGFAGAPVVPKDNSIPPPDSLAFYLPFHYFYPTWWGVYLIAEGVQWLSDFVRTHSDGVLLSDDATSVARVFLYSHEVFHNKVETFGLRLEHVHRTKLYKTAFERLYQRTVDTENCLEEALANAHAYLRVQNLLFKGEKLKRAAAIRVLKEYIRLSSAGYRQGLNFIKKRQFDNGQYNFAELNYRECFPQHPKCDADVWRTFPYLFSAISRVNSRVNYIVHRASPLASRARLGSRYLTYRQLEKRLMKTAHCEKVGGGKGSHETWQRPDGCKFSVPRHPRDLCSGTLRAIIREAGLDLSISQFAALKV